MDHGICCSSVHMSLSGKYLFAKWDQPKGKPTLSLVDETSGPSTAHGENSSE